MTTRDLLADREAVRATITAIAHHIDARRWTDLRTSFAETVVVDYTSLFGGEIQTQKAEDLVATWRTALTPVTATQHLLGPIDVDIGDPRTRAECHVRGDHFRPGLAGGELWTVVGHYLFDLDRRWRVTKMTLQTYYQGGNVKLLEQAAAL